MHQRHGGRAEDLQHEGQPQDGQTVRGHQHHQHHHKVIARLRRVLYSVCFFYQNEKLKEDLSKEERAAHVRSISFFILQHHIMNNLQKAIIKSTGNKGFDTRCASTFERKHGNVVADVREGVSHVQFFFYFICIFIHRYKS